MKTNINELLDRACNVRRNVLLTGEWDDDIIILQGEAVKESDFSFPVDRFQAS